jgi:hypothetical protein
VTEAFADSLFSLQVAALSVAVRSIGLVKALRAFQRRVIAQRGRSENPLGSVALRLGAMTGRSLMPVVVVLAFGLSNTVRAQSAQLDGVVVDSLSRPVSGATVVTHVLRASGDGQTSHVDQDITQRTDSAGRFVFAGLTAGGIRISVLHPAFRPLTLRARVSSGVSVSVRITLSSLPPDANGSLATTTPRTRLVRGVVVDSDQRPVADAEVGVIGGTSVTRSDSLGRFSFTIPVVQSLPTILRARRLGYRARMIGPLERMPTTDSLVLSIRSAAVELGTVRVQGSWSRVNQVEFERRKALYGGVHVSQAEIEQRNVREVSRFSEGRAGFSVRDGIVLGRGRPLQVIVNGSPLPAGIAVDEFVSATEIAAIEAYSSYVNVPAEFAGMVLGPDKRGGVLVIWTK